MSDDSVDRQPVIRRLVFVIGAIAIMLAVPAATLAHGEAEPLSWHSGLPAGAARTGPSPSPSWAEEPCLGHFFRGPSLLLKAWQGSG